MLDAARRKTDKRLNEIERNIGRLYKTHPALKRIQKDYDKYMSMVQTRTDSLYRAFIDETDKDIKSEAKMTYIDAVERLTIKSKEYQRLVKKIVKTLAQVNQDALDITNDSMAEIYTINYNQVAEECKRVGIKVND